jgi:hypothetical protein
LYDLNKDPMEWTNLIRLNDKKANKAKGKLQKWIPRTSAPNLISNSATDSDKETEGKGSIQEYDKIRPLNELK